MNYAQIAGVILLIIIIAMLFAKLRVIIEYDGGPSVRIKLLMFQYTIPLSKEQRGEKKPEKESKPKKEKKPSKHAESTIYDMIGFYTNQAAILFGKLKAIFARFMRRLVIDKLVLNLRYGTGDPATTGMSYGFICAGTSAVIPALDNFFDIRARDINITPVFLEKCFDAKLILTLYIRVIYFPLAAISIIAASIPPAWRVWRFYKKGKII